jgi:transcriptional regulator with XRE-family HTH domain
MNKRKDIVPNNLKEYRLKIGLTQKQVSQRLGFTNEVALCHWEQGKNIPNLINLSRLCALYQATPMELFQELFKK